MGFMEDDEVKAYFTSLDLDIEDAWTFFNLLDLDQGHTVELNEFLMGCARLRGPAKALDFAKLMRENHVISKQLEHFMTVCGATLAQIANIHGITYDGDSSGRPVPPQGS